MQIYQSLITGALMTPAREIHNGIMFYECDADGEIVLAPRAWNFNKTPCRQAFYVTKPFEDKIVELTPEQLKQLKNK